jgi:hypothetical protein
MKYEILELIDAISVQCKEKTNIRHKNRAPQ